MGGLEQVVWTAAAVAPVGLVMVGGGVLLIARRDRVGRPAAVAGVTLLVLFAFNVARAIAAEVVLALPPAMSGPGHALVMNAVGVFGSVLHAAGAAVVVRCVALSQRRPAEGRA